MEWVNLLIQSKFALAKPISFVPKRKKTKIQEKKHKQTNKQKIREKLETNNEKRVIFLYSVCHMHSWKSNTKKTTTNIWAERFFF